MRLYGGWLDEQGVPSPSARWLLPLLPALRGRRQGLIVRPTLATTMLQFPDVALHGTFVADTLRSCGAPLTGDPDPTGPTVPEAELRVMERLMRAYRRTNLVCLQDDKLSALFSDYHWPPVRKRLVEHGIVKVEDRARSGRPKQFLRSRFLPGQIMAGRVGRPGTDPRIRAFWEALAASAA